jgi:outer membrane receptor protein involved in Fe transport
MQSKQLVFKKTLVARALFVAFGATALTVGINTTALAQTNVTGTIYGQVAAAAGTTILIVNKETGARRTLTPDSTGRFNAQSLATGPYKVEQIVNGTVVKTQDNVEVRIGQGSEVTFGTTLQTVQVIGLRQKIDVTSMGSTTVFTASDLAKVPVANNVGSVIQLAPNTTRGDSRYGGSGAPSFGGSSASENAYYINGFPVTTLLTQVGFSQLPFNSIAQAQVLTGGYGAEFGRSTGGVVNIVTKTGGNSWVAGGMLSYEPNSLRSREKDQFYEPVGTALDGKILFHNDKNTQTRDSESFYIGGPLIKDKLFMFLSGEQTTSKRDSIRQGNSTAAGSILAGGFQEQSTKTPRYLLKLDWNVTDAHRLEYTRISDRVENSRKFFGFNYQTLQRNDVQNGGADYLNWGPTPVAATQGSTADIFKYTGYFTDDLTFTALLGRTNSPHELTPSGYNPALAQVTSSSADQIPGFTYNHPQTTTGNLLVPGAFDKNEGARVDVEYKLNASHNLRAGIDRNKITSKAGAKTAGGNRWIYGKTDPNVKLTSQTATTASVTGNPYAQQGYYVDKVISATESTPTVDQSAWYIEDRYKVTDTVLLSLGLRNEGFNNKNGDGLSYVNLPTQLAPRIGLTWDFNGDSTTKVFANLGRYHVPLPTNVAVRGAGSSLNTTQSFVYTGVDANGAPTGLTALSTPLSANNEYGQAKDPRTVAAQDMKGNYQDELAFGMEKALSKDLNVGAKVTYRTLRTAIDDHCDDRPFLAWATRNNVDSSHFGYNCALFNPGIANTFNIDINGDGKLEVINLSAAELGVAPVKRKYFALDLFAEHPFDGKWWGKATYTWSRNNGNTEGQTLSDIGQADVATTQAYDFPEFSVNADGLLPNNRTHQLKIFGYYQITPEWGVGGNMLAASGRPKNCIGNAPSLTGDFFDTPSKVTNYSTYGSAYFFCDGVAAPRGSFGTLPADVRLDMNVVYKPDMLKGFAFKVDVFNLFNNQVIETIEERKYNRNATSIRTQYTAVQSYAAPRSVKLTATYDHKF